MAASLTNLYNNFNIGSASWSTSALSFTAGHLVIVSAIGRHNANTLTVSSLTDTASNTWNSFPHLASVQGGDTTYAHSRIFWCIANATGSSTITVNWSTGPTSYSQLIVDDESGIAWSGAIGDVQGVGSGASIGSTIATAGTSTGTAQANELLYVSVYANNAGTFTLAGYTAVVNDVSIFTTYKEVTSIQSSGFTVTVTVTTAQGAIPFAMQVVTFKEPGGATGGGPLVGGELVQGALLRGGRLAA